MRSSLFLDYVFVLYVLVAGNARADGPPFDVSQVVDKAALMPKGERYEALVPDTLDLAEQARLSLNCHIGNMDPNDPDGVYQSFSLTKAQPAHASAITWNITVKNARTIPTLRAMNGDDFGIDAEYRMLRALLNAVGRDGLLYYPFDGQGPPKGTSYPQSNAVLMFAMQNHQGLDGNPHWQTWIDLLAKGLRDVTIRAEDRAFYPMQAGVDPRGEWHVMNLEGEPPYGRSKRPFDYDPRKEPDSDALGYEGAARAEANRAMAVLARHYQSTGNVESLDVARRILRFALKPGMWADNMDQKRYPGAEHGIWAGHFHNGTQGICGLIDVAVATDSGWLKEFCRECYEHTRRNGVIRMGWFPAWSTPERCGHRSSVLGELTEPCALGDMIVAAVKLSDAGLGDYWDDVDSIVRNHLVEQQVTDLDRMRKMSGVKAGTPADERLKRFRGGFAGCGPTRIHQASLAGCCTANGSQGYYYAWHGITRCDHDVAKVNLFLNRASSWMDIDSHLPYEGKLVLHNKTARTALLRIPAWADADKFICHVEKKRGELGANGNAILETMKVTPPRLGNLLVFQALEPDDRIVLEFPLPASTDRYTIGGKKYTVKFRGSTVVDIGPRDDNPQTDYQLYLRSRFLTDKAPMHRVQRFVAEGTGPLGAF
jgi:hypothetical protein